MGLPSTPDKAQKAQPLSSVADDDSGAPGFGWTQYAEQTNGRFAMVGFVALLVLELFTKQDFFSWIGLR